MMIILQLPNRSTRLLRDAMEDVLVEVGEFIFPVDFMVAYTKKVPNAKPHITRFWGTFS